MEDKDNRDNLTLFCVEINNNNFTYVLRIVYKKKNIYIYKPFL